MRGGRTTIKPRRRFPLPAKLRPRASRARNLASRNAAAETLVPHFSSRGGRGEDRRGEERQSRSRTNDRGRIFGNPISRAWANVVGDAISGCHPDSGASTRSCPRGGQFPDYMKPTHPRPARPIPHAGQAQRVDCNNNG